MLALLSMLDTAHEHPFRHRTYTDGIDHCRRHARAMHQLTTEFFGVFPKVGVLYAGNRATAYDGAAQHPQHSDKEHGQWQTSPKNI